MFEGLTLWPLPTCAGNEPASALAQAGLLSSEEEEEEFDEEDDDDEEGGETAAPARHKKKKKKLRRGSLPGAGKEKGSVGKAQHRSTRNGGGAGKPAGAAAPAPATTADLFGSDLDDEDGSDFDPGAADEEQDQPASSPPVPAEELQGGDEETEAQPAEAAARRGRLAVLEDSDDE